MTSRKSILRSPSRGRVKSSVISPTLQTRNELRIFSPARWRRGAVVVVELIGPVRLMGAGAAALVTLAYFFVTLPKFEPPEEAIPGELEHRAPLLAKAWVAGDMRKLVRLTDSSRDRELRRWLGKTRVQPRKSAAGDRAVVFEIVSMGDRSKSPVDVVVRIGALNGEGLEHLFHQQWVRREDAWYFVPSARQSRTERKRAPRAYR